MKAIFRRDFTDISTQQPSYTKRIEELSYIYVKNGKVLKNRDGVSFDLREKVAGFDNIVIENKGVVNIYCKEYYACNYSKVIEFLNQHIKTEGIFIIHTPKEENYV